MAKNNLFESKGLLGPRSDNIDKYERYFCKNDCDIAVKEKKPRQNNVGPHR